jgi:hypothetical protein
MPPDEPTADAESPEEPEAAVTASVTKPGPKLRRTRGITAWVLVVLVAILFPLSVMTVWVVNTVTNTDHYVETMAPIATNPVVISHTSTRLTDELFSTVNVQKRITSLLPKKAKPIAAPLTNTLHSFVNTQVTRALSSSLFQKVWNNGNRRVSTTLVAVLSGQNTRLTRNLRNGQQIVINLTPVVNQVVKSLNSKGITFFNPAKVLLTTKNGGFSISLMSADQVKSANKVFNLAKTLKWAVPVITLVLAAAAVAISTRRRKTLMRATVGGAMGLALFLVALRLVHRQFVSGAVKNGFNGDVASIIFNTLLRFLKDGLWLVLAILLVAAVIEWFVGPGRYAVALRHQIARAWRWVVGNVKQVTDKEHREAASAGTMRTARWIRERQSGLRLLGVAVAGIFLVFSGSINFAGLLITVLILAAYFGLLQLVVLWADRIDIGTGSSDSDGTGTATGTSDPAGVGSSTPG